MPESITHALQGLPPEAAGETAEAFFEAFPWEGSVDPGTLIAGEFLDAL